MAHQITKEVEDRVRAYIRAVLDEVPVSAVYVFGSHAKGSAHEGSDLDVAVISPSFEGDSFSIGAFLQKKLWDSPYKNIDVVGYSPHDFEDVSSPLIAEIRKHGVLVTV
jgi:uncharacterized protein